MEQTQKQHIIKNIGKLVECTKHEESWNNFLLQNNLLTQRIIEEISSIDGIASSRIRKTYLECLNTPTFDLLIQSLKNSQNDYAANILEELFATSLRTSSKKRNNILWFGMQPVTKHYKGRDEELQTIHDYFLKGYGGDLLTCVSLTGLGGIGKSELARKYAHKFYTEIEGHCIWINAENDSTISDSYHGLATKVGILLHDSFGKEKTLESLTFDVFRFLSKENCLVIFDNIENHKQYSMKYFMDFTSKLRPMQPKPFVIITSRYRMINDQVDFVTKQIDLKVLSVASAISYFKDALNIAEEKIEVNSDLQSLCLELDRLPLAMQQSAAYINEKKRNSNVNTEIKEYLKIFKRETKNLLEYRVPKYQNRDSFSKPAYLTWQITLDKFKLNPKFQSAVTLALNIISFFQSENISLTLLKSIIRLAVLEPADLTFCEGGPDIFETLHNYSMCQINTFDNEACLSVHRLVQTVSQIKLKEQNKWTETLNLLLQIVDGIFQDAVPNKQIAHIVSLLKHTEGNTDIIVKPEKFFTLLHYVQNEYIKRGLYQQGKTFSEFAVKQIMQLYGNEERQTWRIMTNYGHILVQCGDLTEAELLLNKIYQIQLKHEYSFGGLMEYHEAQYTKTVIAKTWLQKGSSEKALQMLLEVLEVQERVVGIDHIDILTTKNNIAETHASKGNYDEALNIYLEVLEASKRVLGIDHPDTLTTKNNIALTHDSKGNYDEALNMYFEVMEASERVLGIDHPETLTTKNNIALAHDSKGNYDEALKMYLEVLEVKERVLGSEHPDVLTTKNNIAAAHDCKGNYFEALKIYLEVLEMKERVLGIDHPETLTTKSNIAGIHESKGNYDEALNMYLKVLEVSERVRGIDHPRTLTTKNNIAWTHSSKGNYDESLKIYLEVLEVQERVLGIDHPDTVSTKSNIASTHHSKGNYDEAFKMYWEILEVRERILGIEHPETLTTKSNIAGIHDSKGNYEDALKMYLEGLEAHERVIGADHPDTLTMKNNIALTYDNKGNYDEALRMYLEVLEASERVLGSENPDTLTTKNNIASIYLSKGKYDEALKMCLDILDVQERLLGTNHPDILSTKNNIALAHDGKGNYDEALKINLNVLAVSERVFGINHPRTLTTKKNIAGIHNCQQNYETALKLYLEVLEGQGRVLGFDHPRTLATKNKIAEIHNSTRYYDEALKL